VAAADEGTKANPMQQSVGEPAAAVEFWVVVVRRWRPMALALGALLCLCGIFCLMVPKQYEAHARVALQEDSREAAPGFERSLLSSQQSAPVQQETVANLLRSDRVAWQVITDKKLWLDAGFAPHFAERFPGYDPAKPSVEARGWLLDRFAKKLKVEILPRTVLVEIRFRARTAASAADLANAVVVGYGEVERSKSLESVAITREWMAKELAQLKLRTNEDLRRMAEFQRQHGLVTTPGLVANGQQETQHTAVLAEVDELGKEVAAATSERMIREAEYRAVTGGDPEAVAALDARLAAQGNGLVLQLGDLRKRKSELEVERAQLRLEHGPNFPRVLEVEAQINELEAARKREDAKLVESYRMSLQAAQDRESMARKTLEEHTRQAMDVNDAAAQYVAMREEAAASRTVYNEMLEKMESAGVTVGLPGMDLEVVDWAREPRNPVRPNPPLYFGITFVVGFWMVVGGSVAFEWLRHLRAYKATLALMLMAMMGAGFAWQAKAQAPTPNTSGLPTGVVKMPAANGAAVNQPNPRTAPTYWGGTATAGNNTTGNAITAAPMAAAISVGDALEVSEYRTPEVHCAVRVAADGTVEVPMVQAVKVVGLSEQEAARAIEQALVAKGILLHPQVQVVVTAYSGQDVSVLGEVVRPGVYPYAQHHRLLDLISAASGVSASAGRLVNVYHRGEMHKPLAVVLDPEGSDAGREHNPELEPGDTVEVSRAGLIYVVGGVQRPGGFPVDPVKGLTVVQALSLAWGPTGNASLARGVLIREQKSGRTVTSLNLKRMLRGLEPDQSMRDRDILYVPDSAVKTLVNRTLESAIQSAIGVSIYSGLVYSTRY